MTKMGTTQAAFDAVREYTLRALGSADVKALAVAATPESVKRRAAVVAHDGFAVVDWYAANRVYIFGGSAAFSFAALVMAWVRRERGPETIAAWLVAAMVSGGVAYVTRPTSAPGAEVAPGDSLARVNALLDARAAKLDQTEPGWQARSLSRLLG